MVCTKFSLLAFLIFIIGTSIWAEQPITASGNLRFVDLRSPPPVAAPIENVSLGIRCRDLLAMDATLAALGVKQLEAWKIADWTSYADRIRDAIDHDPVANELERQQALGVFRTGPYVQLKDTGINYVHAIGADGSTQRVGQRQLIDLGFLKNHYIPRVREVLGAKIAERRIRAPRSPEELELIRQSRSLVSNHWRRIHPIAERPPNAAPGHPEEVQNIFDKILKSENIFQTFEIFEQPESTEIFLKWISSIDIWKLPAFKNYLDHNPRAKKLVELIKSDLHQSHNEIHPDGYVEGAEIYDRLRLIFSNLFRYILIRTSANDVQVIRPRKLSNGSVVVLMPGFQIQVFYDVEHEISKLRFLNLSTEKLVALGERKEIVIPRKQVPATPTPIVNVAISPRGTHLKSGLSANELRWREAMKSLSEKSRERILPLRPYGFDTHADFFYTKLLPLLIDDQDLLEHEVGPKLVTKILGELKHFDAENSLQKIRDILIHKREYLEALEESKRDLEREQSTPANLDELPEEFRTPAHDLDWDFVLQVFANHGWVVDRKPDTHTVLKHASGRSIVLVHYGKLYPTAFARTDYRRGQRLLNGTVQGAH